jgi:geranylgeranyl diphosphate synthase, type II
MNFASRTCSPTELLVTDRNSAFRIQHSEFPNYEVSSFQEYTTDLRTRFEAKLGEVIPDAPKSLYDPARHVVAAGGKRVRPILTALCYQLTKQDDGWMNAGIAIELLHTFTLVHDDIMDSAATRRGLPTVHAKYGVNEAILAGDVMIALAQQSLAQSENASALLAEFANGFIRVCEGQAYDKDFEQQHDVTIRDYLNMIDLKTAKIAETAAVLGALAAGDIQNVEALRSFAHHIGIAFQIQDDLLDLTADHADFGKTIGGDILEGKRTFLLLKLIEMKEALDASERQIIERVLALRANEADISPVRSAMQRVGVLEETQVAVEEHTQLALASLSLINADTTHLREFADYLLNRRH